MKIEHLGGISLGAMAAAFGWIALSNPAYPQTANCGPRAPAIAMLQQVYREIRVSIAIDGGGRVIETFANLETGTWTALATKPNGIACIVASGSAYEATNDTINMDEQL